jgi:hypothetical protein
MVILYVFLILSMLMSAIPKGKKEVFPLVFWGGALVWAVFFLITHATTIARINI